MKPDRILSTKEVSAILNIHETRVRRLVYEKRLTAEKAIGGNAWLFRESVVIAFNKIRRTLGRPKQKISGN